MKFSFAAFRQILAAVLVLISLTSVTSVAAQKQDVDPNLYTSELTDFEIEASGPAYQIMAAELQHYPSGQGEVIEIEPESGVSYMEIGLYDDTDSPSETIDVFLDSLEGAADSIDVVDSGSNGQHVYAIAAIDYESLAFVYYIQVTEDVVGNVDQVESFLSTDDFFLDLLTTGQQEVSIDGVSFLSNVDPADVLDVIENGGSLSSSTPAASPQTGSSAVFPASGASVSLGPDFGFSSEIESGAEVESIQIDGEGSRSMIAIGATGDSPEDVLDSYLAGLIRANPNIETIQKDESNTGAVRLLYVPQGDGNATFILLVADTAIVPGYEVLQAHELPSDAVGDSIVALQSQVQINDTPVLQHVNSDDIEVIAGEFLVVDDTVDESDSESTPDDGIGTTGNPRNDARLPTGAPESDTENSSEVNDDPEGTPESNASDDTVLTLTDSTWEGGVFGHIVDWGNTNWYYDESHESDLYSNFDEGEDSIILHSSDATDPNWLFVSIYDSADSTPQDFLVFWQSDEFREQFEESESVSNMEILGSQSTPDRSAVVFMYMDESGMEFIGVREAYALEDGQMLVVTMYASRSEAADLYADANFVTVDGDAVLATISGNRLERFIAD